MPPELWYGAKSDLQLFFSRIFGMLRPPLPQTEMFWRGCIVRPARRGTPGQFLENARGVPEVEWQLLVILIITL